MISMREHYVFIPLGTTILQGRQWRRGGINWRGVALLKVNWSPRHSAFVSLKRKPQVHLYK